MIQKLIHPFWCLISRLVVCLVLSNWINGVPALAFQQLEQNDQAAAETGIEFKPRLGDFPVVIGSGLANISYCYK